MVASVSRVRPAPLLPSVFSTYIKHFYLISIILFTRAHITQILAYDFDKYWKLLFCVPASFNFKNTQTFVLHFQQINSTVAQRIQTKKK